MAKEANKTTTILLLVIAGIFLFLVGSFTGQITFSKGKALTTQQIGEVRQISKNVLFENLELWAGIEVGRSGIHFLPQGDLNKISVQGKIIILDNISPSSGAISVDVDGVKGVIPYKSTSTINGIEITNLYTYATISY